MCSLEHHPSHYALLNNLTFLPRFVSNWLHFTHVHNYHVLLGYIGYVDFFLGQENRNFGPLLFTIVLFYSELLVSFLILYQFLNSSFDIKIAGYTGGISL